MSNRTAFVRDSVLQAIQSSATKTKVGDHTLGSLVGTVSDGEHFVYGYNVFENGNNNQLEDEFNRTVQYLPGGLELCGLIIKCTQASNTKLVKNACYSIATSSSVLQDWFDDIVLIMAVGETPPRCHFYWYSLDSQDIVPAEQHTLDDQHFRQTYSLFRIQSCLEIGFEQCDQQDARVNSIMTEASCLEDRLRGAATVFRFVSCPVCPLLFNVERESDEDSESKPSSKTVSEVVQSAQGSSSKTAKRGVGTADTSNPVDVRLCFRQTGLEAEEGYITCSPIIHHEHRQFQYVTVPLSLDTVVYAANAMPVRQLPSLFAEGVIRQLRAMVSCVVNFSKDSVFAVPKPYHFSLSELDYLISVVFPSDCPDTKLESTRKTLHTRFQIPTTKPVFRIANAVQFTDGSSCSGGFLLNVHNGLKPSGVVDGKQFIVEGLYAYHHYMQDRVDDSGWGCAYRSLQTISSWLRLQGYTDRSIPTHTEIQQALVTVGDKPGNFVGSKKWIGSTEVGFVLDQLFGVSHKILHVPSGAEMAGIARELANHFETQGTPVMIGGGVLAHTILGVDWNESTGEVKFLILDPHYTGSEDIKIIQEKGWCGWKSVDFWDKNAYYNMCLPQRPTVF